MEIDIKEKIKRLHSWMKLSFLDIFINKKRIRRILYKKKVYKERKGKEE